MVRLPRLITVLGLLWPATAAAVHAQQGEQARRYELIPFAGDPEAMLKRRLAETGNLAELMRSGKLDELLKRFQKLGGDRLDLKPLQGLDWKDKESQLKKLIKKLEDQPSLSPDARQVVENVKKLLPALEKRKPPPPLPVPRVPGVPQPAAEPPAGLEERVNRWTLDLLERAQNSGFVEKIGKSTAWNETLDELRKSLASSRGPTADLGFLGKIAGKLDPAILDKAWERVREMRLPRLSGVDVSAPALDMNKVMPNLALPRDLGIRPAWLLIPLAGGIMLILLWQLRHRTALGRQAGWRLGPWPVHPARIASAPELLAAFEYLSLLRLGPQARTSNHLAIAGQLGGRDAESRRAAGRLAFLYEEVRYHPEPTAFSGQTLAAARRDLCFLAGVANR